MDKILIIMYGPLLNELLYRACNSKDKILQVKVLKVLPPKYALKETTGRLVREHTKLPKTYSPYSYTAYQGDGGLSDFNGCTNWSERVRALP